MRTNTFWPSSILGVQVAFTSLAAEGADTNRDADIEALKQQINALSQKVKALERQNAAQRPAATNVASAQIRELDWKVRILSRVCELHQGAAEAQAGTQPKLDIGSGGFSAISADSNFVFSLHGVVQVDSRTFFNDSAIKSTDGFLIRRARPIFQGTLHRDFDFKFTPDFAPSTPIIFDAYGNYRYEPWLQLRAGKFKTPEGL